MKDNRLHSHQEQVRKLEEIGARLRQARIEKSIALEDVAAQTRIQARLLNAIEQGRLDQLPEPVYIRGFIKRYAEALGLDGDELAYAFPGGSSLQKIRPSWRHIPVAHLRPFHLYLFYIVLVIGSVNGLSYLVSRSAQEAMNAAGYQSPAPQLPQPSNSLQPPSPEKNLGATKASDAKQFSQDGPVQVGVTLKEKSWIRVVADGKTTFE
ncbi:MAG TPA: helix-turn-helix domain-containing protein, partial [Coleofasciculaceae cyanobacterium]